MLAVTGSSVHSGRITGHGSSRGRSSARKHKKHHHHHHHHHPHEPLRVSLAKATAESSNNVRETLRTHLEPHLAGGLSALFVAFRFMIEDHGLSLGSGEVKDVLISLGFTAVTSDDALALHKVLLGPNRQRKKALRLHDVATILGTPENTVAEDSKLGEKSTTKTLKEGGGHNAQQLHNLVGDTITRHVKKAIVRSETRQHKGWLVQPTDKLLERLRHKMKEHLPGTASYLETFRLFKHGHGADISLEEFRHTIRDDFGLAVPEKRLRRLFETFDTQRKGTIDFGDFVAHVWEPNIRRESVILRDDIQKQKLKRSLAKAQKQYETSSIGPLSLEAAAQIIRDKLSAHIQGGHVLQAFREFHHGHGKMEITRPEFMHEIKVGLGIKLAREPEDYDALFDHFDTDGDGSINFQEFTHELLHDEAIGMSGGGGADDTSQRFNPVTAHQSSVMLGPNVNIKSVFKNRLLAHLDSGPNEISRAFHKLKMYGDGKARNNLAGVGLQDFIAAVGRLGMSVEQRRVETLFREIAGRDATLMTLEAFRDGLFKETYSSSISFGSNQNNKKLLSQQKSADVTRVQRKLNKLRDDTDVRNLIKTKLEEKLSGGANALLRAFRSFHSGHGLEISEAEFHKVVNTLLEISMPREETLLLFQEIDTDGNGTLDYAEFVDEIMGADAKAPIRYGKLRKTAIANRRKARKAKYSILNPNTSRGGRREGVAEHPAVSPIKRRQANTSGPQLTRQGKKRLKQMKHAFEREDLQHSGVLVMSKFVLVLSNFQLAVDAKELSKIQERYGRQPRWEDPDAAGQQGIHYPSFLVDMRKIMVAETEKERQRNTLNKNTGGKRSDCAARDSEAINEAERILSELITRQWRQLQFSFTQHDKTGKGLLEMRTVLSIMSRADPRVGGLVPFLVPKLREVYATPSGLIDFERMIRSHIKRDHDGQHPQQQQPRRRRQQQGKLASLGGALTSPKTGRASDSFHRPLTWRLKDSLSRAHKANAVVGRVRLQLGSADQRKAALTQFQMRDPANTKFVEKSLLRSLFARQCVKVSAADVKRLSFCFEVPKQAKLFNYVDFFRVVERGF